MDISQRTTAPPSFPADVQWFYSESRRAFRAGLQTERPFPDRLGIIMAAGAATRFRPLTASGLQQVEHESLMLHEGRYGELPVPELVAWGKGQTGDAYLVTRWLDGDRLRDRSAGDVDDTTLEHCWKSLDELHAAGIVHRAIDRTRIVVTPDRIVLDGMAAAQGKLYLALADGQVLCLRP